MDPLKPASLRPQKPTNASPSSVSAEFDLGSGDLNWINFCDPGLVQAITHVPFASVTNF